MKRNLTLASAAVTGAAVFVTLVVLLLHVAQVAEPSAHAVTGPTARRLWATAGALLGLFGVIAGGRALARRHHSGPGRLGSRGAMVAGVLASVDGLLVLALAGGGPGSGNGVVGGAAALVLGVAAVVLGTAAHRGARKAPAA